MKKFILLFVIVLFGASAAAAQQPTPIPSPQPEPLSPAPPPPPAIAADVASMDAIIKAVYDVISGDAGQKRDWNRFRSLFHPSARLIPTVKNPTTGVTNPRAMTPEEYITRSSPLMERDGFHEQEVARRAETFGNIAHVFSTYEARRKTGDAQPFLRGINSIQLVNDGKRWWILTIFWQAETTDAPLPEKYLKGEG